MSCSFWDGQREDSAVSSFWNGSEEVPASIGAMPTGYSSVASMLDSSPFYIAHRGGSGDWPEMTLLGQTESVARGVGALEISLSRSSDGVWFGLHDETFDRTSGLSGTPLPSTLTWAEINERFTNEGDRYYTLQELIEPWKNSHVFFIDPKYNHQRFSSELGPLLKTLVDDSRVVIKYFGSNVTLATAAKNLGYVTWGYYYPANIDSGMFDSTKNNWDILGMTYDASQAYWNTTLSTGKPVIGHICPTSAAVNSALSKGAAGAMVSGVKSRFGQTGL